jgi:hypothetical protein
LVLDDHGAHLPHGFSHPSGYPLDECSGADRVDLEERLGGLELAEHPDQGVTDPVVEDVAHRQTVLREPPGGLLVFERHPGSGQLAG